MKFRPLKFGLYFLAIITLFISCNNDDDDTIITVEIRDRTEQQIEDKASLLDYLSTHYYNSSFFDTDSNHKYSDIIISELDEGEENAPDGHTLLIDAVLTLTTTYSDAEYEYYVLNLNQGGGMAPEFSDAVRVKYEGTSLESQETFDKQTSPIEIELEGNGISTFGTIRAWQLILPQFNSALDFNIIGDGTIDYMNFGLGVMFVPSGLGYFSGSNTGTAYDNLVFKFELLQVERVDHDNDGIPSFLEDLDADLDIFNDDNDGDNFPDFIDLDDDNDGVGTFDEIMLSTYIIDTNNGEEEPVLGDDEVEISRSELEGVITINTLTLFDTNDNDIPDYLDEDITINYNEEES